MWVAQPADRWETPAKEFPVVAGRENTPVMTEGRGPSVPVSPEGPVLNGFYSHTIPGAVMKSRGRGVGLCRGQERWTGLEPATSTFAPVLGSRFMWNEIFLFPVFSTYQLNNEHCDQRLSDI